MLLNQVGYGGHHARVNHGLQVLFANLNDMSTAVPVGHVKELAGGLVVRALVGGNHLIGVLALVKACHHFV